MDRIEGSLPPRTAPDVDRHREPNADHINVTNGREEPSPRDRGYPPGTMPSERLQRRIDRLLDQAESAADAEDWPRVRELSQRALALPAERDLDWVFDNFCWRAGVADARACQPPKD